MNEEKIAELKEKIRVVRESRNEYGKRSQPVTPPRYDDVFFNGIKELFGEDI